jgi:hypothetical protein
MRLVKFVVCEEEFSKYTSLIEILKHTEGFNKEYLNFESIPHSPKESDLRELFTG